MVLGSNACFSCASSSADRFLAIGSSVTLSKPMSGTVIPIHPAVIVAHGANMVLLYPSALCVHTAKRSQHHCPVSVCMPVFTLSRRTWPQGMPYLPCRGTCSTDRDCIQCMVGQARSAGVEIVNSLFQCGEHILCAPYRNARQRAGKLGDVIRKTCAVNIDALSGRKAGSTRAFSVPASAMARCQAKSSLGSSVVQSVST